MKSIISVIVLITIAILPVSAQSPQGISYQAVAYNSAGSPLINANIGVRISILDNSVNGPVIYSEIQNTTTDSKGLYSLLIGKGTPVSGNYKGINWNTQAKFLRVEIDPNGGSDFILSGTNQLMLIPAAAPAKSRGNENGRDRYPENYERDSEAIGIMTSSFGYAFENGQWYQQMLSGEPQKIISTARKIGIMTSSYGYVFNGGQWYSQVLWGEPQEILGNFGVIGILTSSYAYAFNNNQWYQQMLMGDGTELVVSRGLIGIMTSSYGYAFSNNQWYSRSLFGTPEMMIARNGKILLYTSSYAYIFDKETNQWYQQALFGTPIDFVH